MYVHLSKTLFIGKFICLKTHAYRQTYIYSDTFNISHIIIRYSLESGNNIRQVKLCPNKFILIMSDYFDRKVWMDYNQPKKYSAVKFQYTIRSYQFRSTN